MRIRMQVAAVEVISDTAALVKLYPVKEQPEDSVFPSDMAPQGSFAVQIARDRIPEMPIGKEFDLLFALPITQVPVDDPRLVEPNTGNPTPEDHKNIVAAAERESKLQSLHGVCCNLRTGEGPECNCGYAECGVDPAPDYNVEPATK
jgi:hypothetical protein